MQNTENRNRVMLDFSVIPVTNAVFIVVTPVIRMWGLRGQIRDYQGLLVRNGEDLKFVDEEKERSYERDANTMFRQHNYTFILKTSKNLRTYMKLINIF